MRATLSCVVTTTTASCCWCNCLRTGWGEARSILWSSERFSMVFSLDMSILGLFFCPFIPFWGVSLGIPGFLGKVVELVKALQVFSCFVIRSGKNVLPQFLHGVKFWTWASQIASNVWLSSSELAESMFRPSCLISSFSFPKIY